MHEEIHPEVEGDQRVEGEDQLLARVLAAHGLLHEDGDDGEEDEKYGHDVVPPLLQDHERPGPHLVLQREEEVGVVAHVSRQLVIRGVLEHQRGGGHLRCPARHGPDGGGDLEVRHARPGLGVRNHNLVALNFVDSPALRVLPRPADEHRAARLILLPAHLRPPLMNTGTPLSLLPEARRPVGRHLGGQPTAGRLTQIRSKVTGAAPSLGGPRGVAHAILLLFGPGVGDLAHGGVGVAHGREQQLLAEPHAVLAHCLLVETPPLVDAQEKDPDPLEGIGQRDGRGPLRLGPLIDLLLLRVLLLRILQLQRLEDHRDDEVGNDVARQDVEEDEERRGYPVDAEPVPHHVDPLLPRGHREHGQEGVGEGVKVLPGAHPLKLEAASEEHHPQDGEHRDDDEEEHEQAEERRARRHDLQDEGPLGEEGLDRPRGPAVGPCLVSQLLLARDEEPESAQNARVHAPPVERAVEGEDGEREVEHRSQVCEVHHGVVGEEPDHHLHKEGHSKEDLGDVEEVLGGFVHAVVVHREEQEVQPDEDPRGTSEVLARCDLEQKDAQLRPVSWGIERLGNVEREPGALVRGMDPLPALPAPLADEGLLHDRVRVLELDQLDQVSVERQRRLGLVLVGHGHLDHRDKPVTPLVREAFPPVRCDVGWEHRGRGAHGPQEAAAEGAPLATLGQLGHEEVLLAQPEEDPRDGRHEDGHQEVGPDDDEDEEVRSGGPVGCLPYVEHEAVPALEREGLEDGEQRHADVVKASVPEIGVGRAVVARGGALEAAGDPVVARVAEERRVHFDPAPQRGVVPLLPRGDVHVGHDAAPPEGPVEKVDPHQREENEEERREGEDVDHLGDASANGLHQRGGGGHRLENAEAEDRPHALQGAQAERLPPARELDGAEDPVGEHHDEVQAVVRVPEVAVGALVEPQGDNPQGRLDREEEVEPHVQVEVEGVVQVLGRGLERQVGEVPHNDEPEDGLEGLVVDRPEHLYPELVLRSENPEGVAREAPPGAHLRAELLLALSGLVLQAPQDLGPPPRAHRDDEARKAYRGHARTPALRRPLALDRARVVRPPQILQKCCSFLSTISNFKTLF